MGREAWHAAAHGVTKSRTQLSNRTELKRIQPHTNRYLGNGGPHGPFRSLGDSQGSRYPTVSTTTLGQLGLKSSLNPS